MECECVLLFPEVVMLQAPPQLCSADLRLLPCRLQALSCNLPGANVGNWSRPGLYWSILLWYICTMGIFMAESPLLHISVGLDLLRLDAAKASVVGDEQEFVKQKLSCRNVVGKSGCCSHFHVYLEAFPYSLTSTNFCLLSQHHSWIKRDFALLWIQLEKEYCDLEQFQSRRCCFSTQKCFHKPFEFVVASDPFNFHVAPWQTPQCHTAVSLGFLQRKNCNVGAEEGEEALSNLDIYVSPGRGGFRMVRIMIMLH